MANPLQKGVILGQLLDPNTPYEWAQEISETFPSMSLLTSQDMRHSASATDINRIGNTTTTGICYKKMVNYLITGNQPRNGITCGNPLPAIEEAFDDK